MLDEVIGSVRGESEFALYPFCGFSSFVPAGGMVTHAYTNFSDIKVRNGEVGASGNTWDDAKYTIINT